MHKEDIFILVVALLLLAAMIYTFLFGGQSSKHGVSFLLTTDPPVAGIKVKQKIPLDLCQGRMRHKRLIVAA